MKKSLKFKFIEENLLNILHLIVGNQNILRYIKILENNPLDPTYPDIQETLINQNIILTPFDPTILTENQVKLFFYPFSGKFSNNPKGKHIYECDIICPYSYWVLSNMGQFRTTRIADEICMLIDGKNITGVGDIEVNEYRIGKVDDNYAVLSLWIDVYTPTINGNR